MPSEGNGLTFLFIPEASYSVALPSCDPASLSSCVRIVPAYSAHGATQVLPKGTQVSETRLTKRVVDAARPGDRDFVIWDSDLTGFGLRVRPTGSKVYVAMYRSGFGRAGRARKITIGKHGDPWTPEAARIEARRLLGAAAKGEDPAGERADARRAITVTQLCDRYLAEGCGTKKPSTLVSDRGRIERHIKPLLGSKMVIEVSSADIKRFIRDVTLGKTAANVKTGKRGRAIVTGGAGTAARTAGLLGGIFSFAIADKLRPDNPVRGVERAKDRKGDRFLSSVELAALGRALAQLEAEGANRAALTIIRLLAFTGARKGEIASLRWSEVDFERSSLRLADSKTGQKVIPIGAPALQLLADHTRDEQSPFVFPASAERGAFQGVDKVWRKVRVAAGMPTLRLHDLRHGFASTALAAGDSLAVIGALLGHSDPKTTSRYSHLSASPLQAAADRTAKAIEEAMAPTQSLSKITHIR